MNYASSGHNFSCVNKKFSSLLNKNIKLTNFLMRTIIPLFMNCKTTHGERKQIHTQPNVEHIIEKWWMIVEKLN